MIMIVEILQGHVHEQLLFAWLSVHHFDVGPTAYLPRLFSHADDLDAAVAAVNGSGTAVAGQNSGDDRLMTDC